MVLAAQKPDSVGRFSVSRFSTKEKASRFVGIDIDLNEVRIAALGKKQNEDSYRWILADQFSLDLDPQVVSTPSVIAAVAAALKEKLPRSMEGCQIETALSLPLSWVHYQTNTAEELQNALIQCDGMFRASIFQSPMNHRSWACASGNSRMMIAATAMNAAVTVAEAVSSVGYDVCGILPNAIAINRAVQALTGGSYRCIVLLEPTGCLTVVPGQNNDVTDPADIGLCRTLRTFGTSDQIDASRNETLRGVAAPLPDLSDVHGWLREIATEVIATNRYCGRALHFKKTDEPVLICGSLAEIPGLDSELASMLDTPVATWSYIGANRPSGYPSCQTDANEQVDSRFSVALSLAYAAATKSANGVPQ